MHALTERTELLLPSDLNEQELRAILSHHFHPSVSLMFDVANPFCSSVSKKNVNALLRDCAYVESLHVPGPLCRNFKRSFLTNTCLQSLVLSFRDNDFRLNYKFLDDISLNRGIKQLELRFHSELLDRGDLRKIGTLVRRLFNGNSCIKKLLIHFGAFSQNVTSTLFAKKLLRKAGLDNLDTVGQLSFFNVSIGDLDHAECVHDDSAIAFPHLRENLQGIAKWDRVIAPGLVLNYYRDSVHQPVNVGLLPLAVQAFNRGGMYRKTTHHAPLVQEVANAGLIFRILRQDVYSDAK
jgi:hypothetical protein